MVDTVGRGDSPAPENPPDDALSSIGDTGGTRVRWSRGVGGEGGRGRRWRGGVGGEGGRVGARWRRGVGEREAASGPILGGLQLEFGSSQEPK